jgi:hypothetical protein
MSHKHLTVTEIGAAYYARVKQLEADLTVLGAERDKLKDLLDECLEYCRDNADYATDTGPNGAMRLQVMIEGVLK